MARTPLMQQLVRLRRLSGVAEQHGVDVAEVQGRAAAFASSDEGHTRREVLRRGAIAAAGTTVAGQFVLSNSQAKAGTPRTQPRIAVVGAGMAGISCARTLRDAGFTNITVYEASDHVGGRTYTNTTLWDRGQWSEWGGELIDSDHAAVFDLCRRYGFSTIDLTTVTPAGAEEILYFGGGYYDWNDMVADWKNGGLDAILDAQMKVLPNWPWTYDKVWSPEAIALSNMTLYDWIERYIPGGHTSRLGQFMDIAYNVEYAEDTPRQSCLDLVSMLGFTTKVSADKWWVWGESDERYKIVGGNQQLATAQAADVGYSNIRLGWRFTALRRNSDGTSTLTFDVGGVTRTVTADRTVMAIPIGVLTPLNQAGAFTNAGFDPRMIGVFQRLGMGTVTKVHVQTSDRFYVGSGPWGISNGESFAPAYQQFWDSSAGEPGTRGIVINYLSGDRARAVNPSKPWSSTADPNSAVAAFARSTGRTFVQQAEGVFPGMTARYTGTADIAAWHTSPYQNGAYCYYPPNYVQNYAGYERVAQGTVHFTGEHCSQDYQGYINGAAVEGIRAANEIIPLY